MSELSGTEHRHLNRQDHLPASCSASFQHFNKDYCFSSGYGKVTGVMSRPVGAAFQSEIEDCVLTEGSRYFSIKGWSCPRRRGFPPNSLDCNELPGLRG